MAIAEEITARILASPKYRALLPRTVEAAVQEALARYGEKGAAKQARAILHQAWGAYYPYRPKFGKLLDTLRAGLHAGRSPRDVLPPALAMHSSTAERSSFLDEFYSRIFAVTGPPESVLDLGCGLNPLSLPWMGLPEGTPYVGMDIDTEQNAFLNAALAEIGLPPERARVQDGDILLDDPPEAGVVFMLKLLPLLEHRRKGAAWGVLRRQRARHIVVSFPSSGLSGRKRMMGEFHGSNFLRLVGSEPWKVSALTFKSELVYIVGK